MSLAPGDTFAGYRIVAPLPSESEDEVYLVSHPQSLRDEVLRVFGPNTEISLRNNWFFDAPQVITTSVTPDVGLARLSATGLDDDRGLWVASQFAEGRTASALLAERGRLDVADVITWTGMVADALDALHRQSIAHGNVGPRCIYISDSATNTEVTLAGLDNGWCLGLALSTELTRPTLPDHPSPEFVQDGARDHRSDQFALAYTVFELLAGHRPFGSTLHEQVTRTLSGPTPVLSHVRPDVPPWIDDALRRALHKDPAQRFPTCRDFVDALSARRRPAPQPPKPPKLHLPNGFRICLPKLYQQPVSVGINPHAKVDDPGLRAMRWYVRPGDHVAAGDPLLRGDVLTGGCVGARSVIVHSPVAGTVLDIRVGDGGEAFHGNQLAVIGEVGLSPSMFGDLPLLIPAGAHIHRRETPS